MSLFALEDAEARYGKIVGNRWPDEAKHCRTVNVPELLADCMTNTASGLPALYIYCNRDMAPALERVFRELIDEDLQELIKSFDGCYHVRLKRGVDEISTHAYALAIDLNAGTNRLGTKGDMDPRIVQVFKRNGFVYGGDFDRRDPQHFQYAAW